jgi:hypothetical protein
MNIQRNLSSEEREFGNSKPFGNSRPYSIKKTNAPSFLEKLERGDIVQREKLKTFTELVKERKQKRETEEKERKNKFFDEGMKQLFQPKRLPSSSSRRSSDFLIGDSYSSRSITPEMPTRHSSISSNFIGNEDEIDDPWYEPDDYGDKAKGKKHRKSKKRHHKSKKRHNKSKKRHHKSKKRHHKSIHKY